MNLFKKKTATMEPQSTVEELQSSIDESVERILSSLKELCDADEETIPNLEKDLPRVRMLVGNIPATLKGLLDLGYDPLLGGFYHDVVGQIALTKKHYPGLLNSRYSLDEYVTLLNMMVPHLVYHKHLKGKDSPWMLAFVSGNAPLADRLLQLGYPLKDAMVGMGRAIRDRDYDIVELILSHEAVTWDDEDLDYLLPVILSGKFLPRSLQDYVRDSVERLEEPSGDLLSELLSISVRQGYRDMTEFLLGKGADPDLYRFDKGTTSLMYASENNLLHSVRLLLEHGADPNIRDDNGLTALERNPGYTQYAICHLLHTS